MTRPEGCLAIAGATATGKSDLAVEVAERLDGEVISADAFTAYRGLDVGTAKPSLEERRGVPHHLIDVKDPREPWSAGEFARRAREAADEILSRGRLPILCGGTGFYHRAFFDGLFEGPQRNEPVREALRAVAGRRGAPFLKRMLDVLDPEAGARVLPGDTVRATRYLEVLLESGKRTSALFRERPGARWERPSVRIVLTLPRPDLYGRITGRFHRSIKAGLVGEVRCLLAAGVPPTAPGFAAIGYRETVELLEGRLTPEEWEERILRDTRRFAKRQETWFRAEKGLVAVEAAAPDRLHQVLVAARPLFTIRGGDTR